MQIIQLITSYSLKKEPTVKDRLIVIIEALLLKKYQVILISTDKIKLKIKNPNFKHVLANYAGRLRKNFFLRLFDELKISLKLIKLSNQKNGDLVFLTIPSSFLLFLSFKLRPKKIHIDFRDLVWEYMFKNKLLLNIFDTIIQKNLEFAKSISYTNEAERKNLSKFNFKKKNMYHISNGVLKSKFKKLKQVKISTNIKPTVAYIGKIGKAQNLKVLVKVAKLMPEINFQIVGNGSDLNNLKRLVKKNVLNNIKFTGHLHWKNLIDVYNKTDILFLQLRPNFNLAFPSKLYEYFSTGKYIIFSGVSDIYNALKKFDNYNTVEYENTNKIVSYIKKYIQSKNFRKISLKNKRLIQSHFIREKCINKFIDSFN